MSGALDTERLEREVKSMYQQVAEQAEADFHFETGNELAERLGYEADDLSLVPEGAIDSFAGVGYHLDLAGLEPGQSVLDLGSGAGLDLFVAALDVTETGSVTGIDMTSAQVEHATHLASEHGFHNVSVRTGYIEDLPFEDATFDAVISNGVINLSAEKERVFDEAYRVLKPGARLAISDIISEKQMPESITSDADLWAACIGGAMQERAYLELIESTGLEVIEIEENTEYQFLSEQAANACEKYGVKSVSLAAAKR